MILNKELYKLSEVQELTQLTQRTIYNHIKSGKLRAVKVGGQWRVEKAELNRFIRGGK